MSGIPEPHGAELRAAPVDPLEAIPLDAVPLRLALRQRAIVEGILSGVLSPVAGFHGRDDYLAILQTGRLASGLLWPIPLTLDVPESVLTGIGEPALLVLLDDELVPVATLRPIETWTPDRRLEARLLFRSEDVRDRRVRALLAGAAVRYVSGALRGIVHADTRRSDRLDARAERAAASTAPPRIACFDWPASGIDAAAVLARATAVRTTGNCIVRVDDGSGEGAGDAGTTSALPVSAQTVMAGLPDCAGGLRDAVLHAIVAQNCGFAAFVHHAGYRRVPADGYPERELLAAARDELSIGWIDAGAAAGSAPDAAVQAAPDRTRDGLVILVHGATGSGKSTLLRALRAVLVTRCGRSVSVFDGDASRAWLAPDLGASPIERRENVLRHARVAAEVARHGGVALLGLAAADRLDRLDARDIVASTGAFVDVALVAAPEVREARDRKRIHALLRSGRLVAPAANGGPPQHIVDADIVIDTAVTPVDGACEQVIACLRELRLLRASASG